MFKSPNTNKKHLIRIHLNDKELAFLNSLMADAGIKNHSIFCKTKSLASNNYNIISNLQVLNRKIELILAHLGLDSES